MSRRKESRAKLVGKREEEGEKILQPVVTIAALEVRERSEARRRERRADGERLATMSPYSEKRGATACPS